MTMLLDVKWVLEIVRVCGRAVRVQILDFSVLRRDELNGDRMSE